MVRLVALMLIICFVICGCLPATDRETEQYVCIEFDAAVRTEPNPTSDIVKYLQPGQTVTVFVPDVEKRVFWYEIELEQGSGWCLIESLVTEDELETALIDRIERDLSLVTDVDRLARVKQYVDEVLIIVAGTDAADQAFRLYFNMAEDFLWATYEVLYPDVADYYSSRPDIELPLSVNDITDPAVKDAVSALDCAGYKVIAREGMVESIVNPDVLQRALPYLQSPYQEYIALRKEELIAPPATDAAVIISWDTLADRALQFERIANQYPHLPESEQSLRSARRYMWMYLLGTDNSPIFSSDTGRLRTEVKESYQNFIDQYPQSEFHGLVSDFYQVLSDNDYTQAEAVREYMMRTIARQLPL